MRTLVFQEYVIHHLNLAACTSLRSNVQGFNQSSYPGFSFIFGAWTVRTRIASPLLRYQASAFRLLRQLSETWANRSTSKRKTAMTATNGPQAALAGRWHYVVLEQPVSIHFAQPRGCAAANREFNALDLGHIVTRLRHRGTSWDSRV